MKLPAAVALLLVSSNVPACPSSLPLKGSVFVESCDSRQSDCLDPAKVLYDYLQSEVDRPAVLTISVQTSPWRIYDADMRIVSIDDFATLARSHLKDPVKRVELRGSWTGVAPDKEHKSLADQLSIALDHYPVSGIDGFLWIAKGGKTYTTHQAFTIRKGSGAYGVHSGEDVMSALASGWPAYLEDTFVREGNADGVMRAAAGWDIILSVP
ncbi:MAG TPA: hypothetical protein VK660_09350 [Xanthomonadaceae bacterium]|nr:hypothetical protein [Xanthomonadaceae bacterium]